MDIDRAAVNRALDLADKIGRPISVRVGLWDADGKTSVSVAVYGSDPVARVLPHVKKIKRKADCCHNLISGSAEIDGIEISLPSIGKYEPETKELPDIITNI